MTRAQRLLVGALAVSLVVVTCGVAVYRNRADHSAGLVDAATGAATAGRAAATAMMHYDYRTLDRDFAWVTDLGTSRFVSDFAVASRSARDLAAATKASSDAKILAVGTDVSDVHHVAVLVFVDQTITEAGRTQPTYQRWRIQLTMLSDHGRWLVDGIHLL